MKIRWLVLGVVVAVLIVPAVALTVDRVLEPDSGFWVRLVAFTPYAVVLYALALVLLLVAWAAGKGSWRRTARGLSVLAVIGLALHLFWASGPYVGQAGAVAGSGRPFTLMTANLMLGQASPSEVVATAVRNNVDVLVLNEVTPQVLGEMQSAGLGEAFAYSAGKPAAGPAGTMVFSRHKVTDVRRLVTKFGSYSMTVDRPGGPFTLIAVHPRPPLGNAAGWAADQHAILTAASAVHDSPALIAGDFNATLDHEPMRELGGRGFEDAVAKAKSGWQPTWPASGEVSRLSVPIPSLVQIDHVLVNHSIRALHTESVTIAGSDHRAVVARLIM
jgi:endonuclease/exonuclease/phosphatase (EEP) superfamily protein YafD